MKAFCLAASLLVLSLPAAADEVSSSAQGAPLAETDTDGLYRLQWLRQKIATENAAIAAASKSENAAEAEFAQKVRAALALAREVVRRAAQGPEPVDVHVRIRCMSKRMVMSSDSSGRPFAPALAWSAVESEQAPTLVTRTTAKACRIQLITTPSKTKAPDANAGMQADVGSEMRPYTVEFAPVDQAALQQH